MHKVSLSIFLNIAVKVDEVGGNDPRANNGDVSIRHTEASWEDKGSYGSPGFRELFANDYVSSLAAFAAISGFLDPELSRMGMNTMVEACFWEFVLQTWPMAHMCISEVYTISEHFKDRGNGI